MMQVDPGLDNPEVQPPKTSGLAVTSLIFSLILCCPLTTILGPLLGLVSVIRIGGNPALKGRGIAVAAILLGAIFTGGWVWGGRWVYETIAVPMFVGPSDALATGFDGDIAGFKDHFYGPGASASDAEAAAFIAELERRYGGFVSCMYNQQGQPKTQGPVMPLDYRIVFADQTADCESEIVFADEQTGAWPKKLGYITIFDDDLGDLTFPDPDWGGGSGAPPEATPPPATLPEADPDATEAPDATTLPGEQTADDPGGGADDGP